MGRRSVFRMSGMQRMRGRNHWRHAGQQLPDDESMTPEDHKLTIGVLLLFLFVGTIIYFIVQVVDYYHAESLVYGDYKHKSVDDIKRLPREDRYILVSKFLKGNGIKATPIQTEDFYYCMGAQKWDRPTLTMDGALLLCQEEYNRNDGVLDKRYTTLSVEGTRIYLGMD